MAALSTCRRLRAESLAPAHRGRVAHGYGQGAQHTDVLTLGQGQLEVEAAKVHGGTLQQVDQTLEADKAGKVG
jgi:hypothetical protein